MFIVIYIAIVAFLVYNQPEVTKMRASLYYSYEATSNNVSNAHTHYQLHSHDEYEIYIFFEGDSKYVVEENTYTLKSGDIIIIRKHELHRVYHNSLAKYHRMVFMISPEFFVAFMAYAWSGAIAPQPTIQTFFIIKTS